MRIWDIPPRKLCRSHLLGEHRELHAIWAILTRNKKGYAHHPETKRWRGKLKALYLRHGALAQEMARREYHHQSPLNKALARGAGVQDTYLHHPRTQLKMLRGKKCECKV
ncbi:MAG: pyrimidine dimer DNA glycosylase/endonuclease V [Candidatus Omnitrophica bacterium]|nr:pyrimidine dimer DNA glycosylase/endonuclease V [Candidatus Omnitrophota bacterium]MBU1925906.1 pyrimidine dimer DNA glycosylase/endonuclease V [Candidatus Omnitrophota bacterium]